MPNRIQEFDADIRLLARLLKQGVGSLMLLVGQADGSLEERTLTVEPGLALTEDGTAKTLTLGFSEDMATQVELDAVAASAADDTTIDGVAVDNTTTPPVTGQVLTFNGTEYIPADSTGAASGDATSIQGEAVSATTPTVGQALVHDGTEYVPTDIATQAELDAVAGAVGDDTTIDGVLVDNTTTPPTTGQVLTYDGTKYVPEDSAGGGDADSIDGVPVDNTTTPPITGQLLGFDGTSYTPVDAPSGDATSIDGVPVDNTTAPPTLGQALIYDGIKYVPQDVASGGGGSAVRSAFAFATASLAINAIEAGSATIKKTGILVGNLTVDRHAWVRFYSSQAARDADSTRAITDPIPPGVGLLGDFVFDSTSGLSIALGPPTVIASSDDTTTIYYRVQNLSAGAAAVTVSGTIFGLE